jgi:tetratricopeptide (TPR) repeat protein
VKFFRAWPVLKREDAEETTSRLAQSSGAMSETYRAEVNRKDLLENAIVEMHKLALIPQGSSIESRFQLIVGSRAGESFLQPCEEPPTLNLRDVRVLNSVYSFSLEPLGVILCHDRDFACFFDAVNDKFTIEATSAGEERVVVVVGDEFSRHGSLGQHESARISFAGLQKKKTYGIGLVILRSPDSLFEEAERVYGSDGSTVEALVLVERTLALNPRHYRAWRRKAYILRDLDRRGEALFAADQCVSVNPDYALGWRCKGAILRDLGEHQPGLDCYLRSLALDPTDPLCWTNKGNALMALGRHEEAKEAYAEAERIGALYPEKR